MRLRTGLRPLALIVCPVLVAAVIGGCSTEDSDIVDTVDQGQAEVLEEVQQTAAVITRDQIRGGVAELAHDAYAGRGPGTVEDRRAQAFIARTLAALGYEPGAPDGSWFQPFDLVSIAAAQPRTWRFEHRGSEHLLAQGSDFIVASGVQDVGARVDDAELVFVGYGIQAPEHDWNDYKDVDLTGKVMVMLNNDPDWDDALFAGARRLYYGRWTYKYESAARQGAAGAIIIHTEPSAGYPWQVVQTSWSGANFELPAADEPRLQVNAWVTEAAMARLLSAAGFELADLVERARSWSFEPVPLGITTSIAFTNTLERTESANVLGRLRGMDPERAEEFVVYTAHHDHLGIGRPNLAGDPADRIYNGARDNASGTAMVLAIAAAYQALPEPPRRSILFAFVGAEEQGLLGSKYYARAPTVAPGRIAANVNFDSGNIWGATHDVTYVGQGKSSIDVVAEQVAAFQGRVVKGDQFPSQGSFYRSDQFSLARIGVPALYVSGGTDFVDREAGWGAQQMAAYIRRNYHQPSDELTDDWNFAGMVQDARFGFMAGWLIANDEEMPRWYEGDEFAAARQRALDAVSAE